MDIFAALESEVRTYCRLFPAVFARARGAELWDEDGRRFLDFFSGAGTLNYGHNEPELKRRLLEYLERDGIVHSLDMATAAKRDFLLEFQRTILRPRGLDYKVQFPGPTGTNAVEAALKLARKVTGRREVVFFSRSYHGVTLGALAVTSNPVKRAAAGVPLEHSVALPFDGAVPDSVGALERFLGERADIGAPPAAIILETVQAEGGVNVASAGWLVAVAELARRFGVLLIVDDIQVGCGRSGAFFSFEEAGIVPDLVCLSKSISGIGLPMALVLLRPHLDVWKPGEHNGTFRGQNLAFVAGQGALAYWRDDRFERETVRKGELARTLLQGIERRYPGTVTGVRGRGLILGLELDPPMLGAAVARAAFERGLMIEPVGEQDEVVKILPPLILTDEQIAEGVEIIERSLVACLAERENVAIQAVEAS